MVSPKIIGDIALFENFTDEIIDITDTDEITGDVINRNFDLYQGKKVIFRNCTKLKTIKANALHLSGLEIENCPKLEHLSAYNNRIQKLDINGLKNLNFVSINYNEVLTDINLAGCENLQELYVNNNKIKDLNLTDNKQLRILYCSYNKSLEKLEIKHLKDTLKTLHCENCLLFELDCSNLEKLTDLFCFNNSYFENDGKISGLTKLNFNNCLALEILDCAENTLEELCLNNHPKLWNVSCKENVLESLVINDCPKLKHLNSSQQLIIEWRWDFSKLEAVGINNPVDLLKAVGIKNDSDILKAVGIKSNNDILKALGIKNDSDILKAVGINSTADALRVLGIKNIDEKLEAVGIKNIDEKLEAVGIKKSLESKRFVSFGNIETKIFIDKSSYSNLEIISFTEGASYFNLEGNPISYEVFPKLKEYGLGTENDPAFEEYLDKKRQEEWERDNLQQPDEGYESDEQNSDLPKPTIRPCPYKIPLDKDSIDHLDLSWRGLNGKLIIEDWPNLKFLNLGNNYLQVLVVKNCPKLRKLIYAHNAMPNEAEIYGCNITEIDNYLYDEFVGKEDEPISEEEQAYIDEQERRERQQEDEGYQSDEEKINHDITEEYLNSLTYEQLFELDIDTVPKNLRIAALHLLPKKFAEAQQAKKEQKELTTKIASLIAQTQQALDKNDQVTARKLLTEIATHSHTTAYKNNQELIAKLQQQLANTTSQLETNNNPSVLPWIIGILLVSIIGLTIFLEKTNKQLTIKSSTTKTN